MARTIGARLDAKTEKMLQEVACCLGWSNSEVLRAGIQMIHGSLVQRRPRRIIGQGEFCSGVADLGSSKERLTRFGR